MIILDRKHHNNKWKDFVWRVKIYSAISTYSFLFNLTLTSRDNHKKKKKKNC